MKLNFFFFSADNILLRRDSPFIAVTDFGMSRRLHDPKELKNKSPVGSPTHWSPEKASMEGHGFPSDLWAAVCVLVHMLSGEPPWLKRFQKAAILNFIVSLMNGDICFKRKKREGSTFLLHVPSLDFKLINKKMFCGLSLKKEDMFISVVTSGKNRRKNFFNSLQVSPI